MRKDTSYSKKSLLLGGAIAVVVLGAGAFVASNQPSSALAQDSAGHDDHAHDHDHDHESAPEQAQPAAKAETKSHDDHAHDHGDEHEEGEEGVVELTDARRQAAGIQLTSPMRGGGVETRISGRVSPMLDAKAAVGASLNGLVERVLVSPGDYVEAGQPLLVMMSADAATLRADVDAAAATAKAARQALDRSQRLYEQGIVARQEVETLEAQALSAEAVARAASARSRATGSPDAAGRLQIVSPIAGVVRAVHVGPGGFAVQGMTTVEVTDPSRVELVFSAPPMVAAAAQIGDKLRVNGGAGDFEATVTGIAVDAGAGQSGATIIRSRPSESMNLSAGAPVTGALVTGADSEGFTVPNDAVQTVDGRSVVFVQLDEGFRATPVLIGRQAGGRTEILSGLTGNEQIAGTNAFLLKAELAKGEAEHSH